MRLDEFIGRAFGVTHDTVERIQKAKTYGDFVNRQIEEHVRETYDGDRDAFGGGVEHEGIGYYLNTGSSIEGVSYSALEWWLNDNYYISESRKIARDIADEWGDNIPRIKVNVTRDGELAGFIEYDAETDTDQSNYR